MYDTPSELHNRLFSSNTQNQAQNHTQHQDPSHQHFQSLTNTRVKALRNGTQPNPYHPYTLNAASETHLPHTANRSQPNLKTSTSSGKVKVKPKSKSTEKLPRSRKSSAPTRASHPQAKQQAPPPPPLVSPFAYVPPQQKNESQSSLRSNGSTNPDVERILAKPTIIKGGAVPGRPRASTIGASSSSHHRAMRRPSVLIPEDIGSDEAEPGVGLTVGVGAHGGESGALSDVSTGTFGVIKGKATSGTAVFGETPTPAGLPEQPPFQVYIHDEDDEAPTPAPLVPASAPASASHFQQPSSSTSKKTTQGYPTPHSPLSPTFLAPPSPAMSTTSSISMYSSDAALSIPAFYHDPRASLYRDDSSDSHSRRSMDTLRTLDTMAGAIRGLGPASPPTIEHVQPRFSKKDKGRNREREVQSKKRNGDSRVDVPATAPPLVPPREVYQDEEYVNVKDDGEDYRQRSKQRNSGGVEPQSSSAKENTRDSYESATKARSKAHARARELITPSPLVLSPGPLVGLPPLASRRSSAVISPTSPVTPRVVGGRATRTVAPPARNQLVVVNGGPEPTDDEGTPVPPPKDPPRPIDTSANANSSGPQKTTVARKVHRVPPPLTLAPQTALTARQRKLNRRASRASSLAVPLSPALSTVSTIAAIISGRPKKPSEKELRRRRFLKLTRTLGEDIPPELLVNNLAGTAVRGHSLVLDNPSRKVGVGARDSKAGGIAGMVWNRHSIAGDELTSPNPRTSGHFETGQTPDTAKFPTNTSSPNVLRKYPSIKRKDPALVVSTKPGAHLKRSSADLPPQPLASPMTPESPPSSAAPYFEHHPFRVVVEDTDGPTDPAYASSASAFSPVNPNGHPHRHNRHGHRDSVYSVRDDIPWMRASLALPIAFETPFIEYAGIAGIMKDVGERGVSPGLLEVGDPRGVYRREKRQGWSGEWNQPHIQDVIEKLRQL